MIISEKWLRTFVNPGVNTEQLAEQLTLAGLEVDAIGSVSCDFTDVVAARVESVDKHPAENKLRVCKVNAGSNKRLTIVCGAGNVQQGGIYPLAVTGACLPGNKKINRSEIKGVESDGMLCSEAELGLSDEAEGLMVLPDETQPGINLSELLDLQDQTLDISLTPNRGDCLSLTGIAREVSVLNDCAMHAVNIPDIVPTTASVRQVSVENSSACPRYCGRVIEAINPAVPTPLWMKEYLRRCGIRSINAIVDITNFVMLELGQPLHAFDNDKLHGNVSIRFARQGETIRLLDDQEYKLLEDTLMIADDHASIAMAGIMGGDATAVSMDTRNIFLESAFFNPQAILGQARKYGLHTDSSHRFERGVDPELASQASLRATELILSICGGKAGPLVDIHDADQVHRNKPVLLRHTKLQSVLGMDIPSEMITRILNQLGMHTSYTEGQWEVCAPSFRFDISIEEDLIEEIARIYGYHRIPEALPVTRLSIPENQDLQARIKTMRAYLTDQGYFEAITYSFVDEKIQTLFTPDMESIRLANPITAEMSVMRTSLFPGLLSAMQYNLNRQHHRMRLFEMGLVYQALDGHLQQPMKLGAIVCGNLHDKQWDREATPCDFFDVKADIEGLLQRLGHQNQVNFTQFQHPALHPGQSAHILLGNQEVGLIGGLHPAICQQLELSSSVIYFELDVSSISLQMPAKFTKLSKFPSIHRDIAIVVENHVSAAEITKSIGNTASNLLKNLELFDVYQGEGIEFGKKSLALGLTFQAESSTLTDGEVDRLMNDIINRLKGDFGATLRE